MAKYERLNTDVDNSIGAQVKAVAVVKSKFADLLSAIQTGNPERIITASIFVASEGGRGGHLVHHEGRESSLHKKGKGSIVILEDRDGVIYWRNLDCEELKFIGHDATCLYDAKSSKVIASHVEWKVQLHVRDDHPDPGNVKLLQGQASTG